jgi:hypothetical protein
LFWLLEQSNLFTSSHEKWEVLSAINWKKIQLLFKGVENYANDIRYHRKKESMELVPPCKISGVSSHPYYAEKGEDNPFFLTIAQIKALYERFDYLSQYSHGRLPETADFGTCCTGLLGIKINSDNPRWIINPNNWLKCQVEIKNIPTLSEALKDADKAKIYGYCILSGQANFAVSDFKTAKKSYYAQHIIVGAYKTNLIELLAHIENNSYHTTGNGCVGSFSGDETFSLEHRATGIVHKVRVYGTSPQGDAWSIYKDGGIYIE